MSSDKCLSCHFVAGMFHEGCTAFSVITPNINDEAAMLEDVGMQDVHFNEVGLWWSLRNENSAVKCY